MQIEFGRHQIDLNTPKVMGILNVTPDSFYDGGRYYASSNDLSPALNRVEAMVAEGASFVDVGGESTRPGAAPVSVQEELDRVIPVVSAIADRFDVVVSVDTSSPEVMLEGWQNGAGLINDVRALRRDGAIEAVATSGLPVCLMHMKGQPGTMQDEPHYDNVLTEVSDFFEQRIKACLNVGVEIDNIILDPGFGFGKTDEHNIALLKNMQSLRLHNRPLLAGLSRKSMLGRLLGRNEDERLAGSLALAQYALQFGASILRVHDVAGTVDVVNLYKKIILG